MKFPDFIIIGAAKCGTTALMINLQKHPDIQMAKKSKSSVEMNFWGFKAREFGIDWYKKKFEEEKLCGEKSVDYWISKKSIRQIKEHIPSTKLILCVRNPVDRAFSNYQMHRRKKYTQDYTFDLFLRNRNYYNKGLYYKNIKNNILPFFDKENLFVCITERMKKNTTEEMRKIYNFLGVSDIILKSKDDSKNITKEKMKNFGEYFSKNEDVNHYITWSLGNMKLEQDLRKKIVEYYKPHNESFYDFLGYKIEGWDK